MKKFLRLSLGISLMTSSVALLIFSVQPAYGEEEHSSGQITGSAPLNVLYVNIDSINNNYLAYTELADSANQKLNAKMASYQLLSENLQSRYQQLQYRVNVGMISVDSAAAEEAAINEGLQLLQKMEIELSILETDAMSKNDSISALVAVYFAKYSETHNVDYVLMYGTGMPIIYANDSLDVTAECVKELNDGYLKSRPKTKK